MQKMYFDHEEVARTMRAQAQQGIEQSLAAVENDRIRVFIRAQAAFIDAAVEAQIQFIHLVNAGHDADFIGRVIGIFIGHLIGNTAPNTEDPMVFTTAMLKAVNKTLAERELPSQDYTQVGPRVVYAKAGGRA